MTLSHKIILGDCVAGMQTLPDGCVQTCITSPPYWGLRDYQGGTEEIGQEETVEGYVEKMVEVFREIKRILRDDGTVWLNLGDSYAHNVKEHNTKSDKQSSNRGTKEFLTPHRNFEGVGIKTKDLIGIPWRVAFALQADGWYLRQDIIWHKPNPMPESVTDRCTKAHEYIFLLSKSPHYYFDNVAIKEKAAQPRRDNFKFGGKKYTEFNDKNPDQKLKNYGSTFVYTGTRNKRSVWTVNTKGYKGAHFAVYPEKLIEPCILAGTSEHGCCSKCGAPYTRILEVGKTPNRTPRVKNLNMIPGRDKPSRLNSAEMESIPKKTVGWGASCECEDASIVPCVVFDPFTGSGTTAVVSLKNGRNYIGTELNPDYVKITEARIKEEIPQTLKGVFE